MNLLPAFLVLTCLWTILPAQDIVAILTRNAGIAMGPGTDIGSLEPGKLADLVLIDGDPLTDCSDLLKIMMVIKEGEILLDNL